MISAKVRNALWASCLLISLIAAGLLLIPLLQRNQAFRQALSAALSQPADYEQALRQIELVRSQDCRINWQASLLARRMAEPPEIEANLEQMLVCSPAAIDWLLLVAPQRADLAQRAAQLYPQQASAWFWLGDLAIGAGDFVQASRYFAVSVEIESGNGLAWCRLGQALQQQEQHPQALEAFWQCCQNGDPGSNGCYGAGRVAERLGDIPAAIRYYRRSHWQDALERADALEAAP